MARKEYGWRLYTTSAGRAVVREELDGLGPAAAAALADVRRRYQTEELLPRELENLKQGLFALRVTLDGCQYRLYFGHRKDFAVILGVLATKKKSKKAPPQDVTKARKRLKSWSP